MSRPAPMERTTITGKREMSHERDSGVHTALPPSKRPCNQNEPELKERGQEYLDLQGYEEKLNELLVPLQDPTRPARRYIGENLPSIKLESCIGDKRDTIKKAIDFFVSYWHDAANSGRLIRPPGEDDALWSAAMLFEKEYKNARDRFMERLTLFLNPYLCELTALGRRLYAVLEMSADGAERKWVIENRNKFARHGICFSLEIPPQAIRWSSAAKPAQDGWAAAKKAPTQQRTAALTLLRSNVFRVWLENPDHRRASSMESFFTVRDEELKNARSGDYCSTYLNRFTGFRITPAQIEAFMEARGLDGAAMSDLARPFREYMHDVLAGGVLQTYLYVQKWLQSLLCQGTRPDQALIFVSPPGPRSGTLVELLTRVIGTEWVFRASSTDEIVGEYNSHLLGKILVVCEAAIPSTDRRSSSVMKHMITSSTQNINTRRLPIYTVPNKTGFMFVLDREKAARMDQEERRYIYLAGSNRWAGGADSPSCTEYFSRLLSLPDEVVAWQLFLYVDPRIDQIDLMCDAPQVTETL